MAFPRATAQSIFLVMDCSHVSVPVPLNLPSVFDALDQENLFLWHFWFTVGLKRFVPSSLLGSSWSCMKSVHLSSCKCRKSRNAFQEAGCEPQLCFSGQFIPHLLFLILVYPISPDTDLIPNIAH